MLNSLHNKFEQKHEHNENIQLMALDLSDETRQIVEYIDPLKTARAVNSFGPLKRGGPDGFKPIVLQMLNINYILIITEIYRGMIRTGHTPAVLRGMDVVFLP